MASFTGDARKRRTCFSHNRERREYFATPECQPLSEVHVACSFVAREEPALLARRGRHEQPGPSSEKRPTRHPESDSVVNLRLELALAVIFLLPLIRSRQTESSLRVSLIVHTFIVLFRSTSFLFYGDIQPMTYRLAYYEWLIFLSAGGLSWRESKKRRTAGTAIQNSKP